MFKIHDRAHEFRVELVGRFAGASIEELRTAWQEALRETALRHFTIDINGLSGYEANGRKLLREMYHHGMQFAAGTPEALVFLREISAPVRRGPALIQEVPSPKKEVPSQATEQARSKAAGV